MANESQPNGTTYKVDQTATQAADGATSYARQARETAVSAVDLQVGAALSAADRVRELVQPWRRRETAEQELKHIRHQLNRNVNKVERRGGDARRQFTRRVQRTRNRVEREVSQRTQEAERQLKATRAQVGDRVSALV